MNQKAYSILFCALLASTFVHEIRAKAAANPSFAKQVQERGADPVLTCELTCKPSPGSVGISVVFNVTTSLVAVVNVTANVAIIIDVNAGLVAVVNGETGAIIVINVDTGKGVYISGGIWLVSKVSFLAFFLSLTSLTVYLNISGAVHFEVKTASDVILTVLNGILAKLILNISAQLQLNIKLGIQLLISITLKYVALLKVELNGILRFVTSGVLIKISVDLAGFLNLLISIGLLLGKFGGIAAVIAAGVVLNLTAILQAGNGLEVLIIIILAIGVKLDIGKALGSILCDVEALFYLIAQLGGNVSIGLTGLFRVLARIVAFINGKVSIDVVLIALIQFVVYNNKGVELTEALNGTLTVFIKLLEQLNLTQTLAGLVVTLKALLSGTLTVSGVSISAIITILLTGICKGTSYLLQVLVFVLIELKIIVALTVSLPYLLLILILQLNSAIGIFILKAIGIAIEIDIGAVTGGLIVFLLKSVTNIVALLLGNFYDALVSLPFIGKIVLALSVAITAATNGEFILKNLLNASAYVIASIKAFFQIGLGISLGVSSGIVTNVTTVVSTTTSVSAYYSFSFSVVTA